MQHFISTWVFFNDKRMLKKTTRETCNMLVKFLHATGKNVTYRHFNNNIRIVQTFVVPMRSCECRNNNSSCAFFFILLQCRISVSLHTITRGNVDIFNRICLFCLLFSCFRYSFSIHKKKLCKLTIQIYLRKKWKFNLN